VQDLAWVSHDFVVHACVLQTTFEQDMHESGVEIGGKGVK
jgi:hypothetical protein